MRYKNDIINQEEAYKKIEDKIKKTNSYYQFIRYITKQDSFKQLFTYEKNKFDAKFAGKAIENIKVLRFICNDETGMKLENEFHDFIIAAISEQDAISSIIDTYLIETKYGNPKREQLNDYTLNDKLFGILEAVFGLDTLILSVNDKKALLDRFNKVMKTDDLEEANKFIRIIEDIYNSVKDEENPLLVNEKIESWKEDIKPYVLAGFNEQLDEISNSKHQTFESYDILYKKVTEDILKIDRDKKM